MIVQGKHVQVLGSVFVRRLKYIEQFLPIIVKVRHLTGTGGGGQAGEDRVLKNTNLRILQT